MARHHPLGVQHASTERERGMSAGLIFKKFLVRAQTLKVTINSYFNNIFTKLVSLFLDIVIFF
jgi:hypothetical protein